MSLITRCPACGTMFKVVPDQLRISEGWVRCGHCSEVFDANAHMQMPGAQRESAPAPLNEFPDEPAPRASTAADRAIEAFLSLDLPAGLPAPDAFVQERSDVWGGDSSSALPVSSGALLVSPESQPAPAQDNDDGLDTVFPQSSMDPETPDAAAPAIPDPLLDDSLSFVQEARRKAFWQRPLIRTLMAVIALLLACMLALQVVVHERDRLAAIEPRLKPWLTLLCAHLGCTVAAPRLIESLVIDSSTFNKISSDVFRLRFTIRNASGAELATPAVEITLTDMQDQTVVRRVFLPAEMGAGMVLPARGEWSAVLNLGVDANGEGGRVAGYRLLAFYP